MHRMIDSHAHYSHARFESAFRYLARGGDGELCLREGNRPELLRALRDSGIAAVLEPGITLASNEALLDLSRQYPGFLFPAVGVHPTRTPDERWQDRRRLIALSGSPGVIAIGETGLDYHLARGTQHRLCQKTWFLYQLRLADHRRLPLILHIRQADRDALRILRRCRKRLHGGVVHCFAGDYGTARAYLELGFALGIGGTLLQEGERARTLCDAVRQLPLASLLVETDAPYVLPACGALDSRKKLQKVRNTSLILPAVVEKIAALKGVDAETVARATLENTRRVFPGIAPTEGGL